MNRSSPGDMLEPDRDQLEIFVDAIFRHAKLGYISLRAFYEDEDKPFRISPVQVVNGNLKFLIDASDVREQGPRARDRYRRRARAVGRVRSDPVAARAKLEHLLGAATVAVRSGGSGPMEAGNRRIKFICIGD